MIDERLPFDEAKRRFLEFIESQGWPTELRWLSRDRLAGTRRLHWVFRPNELISDLASREFYDATRRTPASLRIDALAQLEGQSLVCVIDHGGPSRMLNFGVCTMPMLMQPVSSRVWWDCLRLVTALLGHSSFLKSTHMTPGYIP
jgi:hypothetical protein